MGIEDPPNTRDKAMKHGARMINISLKILEVDSEV